MDDVTRTPTSDLTALTTNIVTAYVSHNAVQSSGLPDLIAAVHAALTGLDGSSAAAEPAVERHSSSEIRRSIKPDALVSFIDGKSYKTLKRHIATHDLDPASYRAKYGLPANYPMVAASYAAQRSELAKSLGLGQLRRNRAAAKVADTAAARIEPAPKRRAGRPRKSAPA